MEGLIVIIILGSILLIPILLLTGQISLPASSITTFSWLEDAYWEYVSGEKGRGEKRHT